MTKEADLEKVDKWHCVLECLNAENKVVLFIASFGREIDARMFRMHQLPRKRRSSHHLKRMKIKGVAYALKTIHLFCNECISHLEIQRFENIAQ